MTVKKANIMLLKVAVLIGCTLSKQIHASAKVISSHDTGCIGKRERTLLWAKTHNKTSMQNAAYHYKKHRQEFPLIKSVRQYIKAAHWFAQNPLKETKFKRQKDGDLIYYHSTSNTFLVLTASCIPRTMFRPDKGIKYWQEQ